MITICLVISVLCSVILFFKSLFSKNIFSKIVFLNVGSNLISLSICFLGSFKTNQSYVDIALIYTLLSGITAIAYGKYFLLNKS
ncbi:monovalent cation/H+ antiporter complex subunit F [Rickettsia endosymbiont of Cardiosporidium cionae]|uniref:monovalent cation/H+ antiporter complex subunit F n=1 Tax=Rickettsia endosymbiont of Cardiosporidium cionae TaxID=2777155 RepID=UPI001895DEE1|nr:monovalent cation/H+ antiporter complex subunit F [Rickettsia endosymbiont of Cardiosporidium cionae]KAF8818454.1 cation:proton antiporter [Rickettsia endosymbiont of Cardiosporidium cionae]